MLNIPPHQFANTAYTNTASSRACIDRLTADLQYTNKIDDVFSVMKQYVQSTGIELVTYININTTSNFYDSIALSNFPSWWHHIYLSDELVAEDIILTHCDTLRPKLVDQKMYSDEDCTGGAKKDRLLAMGEAGFRNGFVAPITTPTHDRIAGWSFGCSLERSEFVKLYAQHGCSLRLVGLCAHQRIEALRTSTPAEYASHSILSKRERECLTHIAAGKRSPLIARMMNISLSTVEFHIKGIKKKLKTATREEAVAKALTRGYISYSD